MSILNYVSSESLASSIKNRTIDFIEIADLVNKGLIGSIPETERASPLNKRFLIAFEGINCCGKSTQIARLRNYLDKNQLRNIYVRDSKNSCWGILSNCGKGTYLINNPLADSYLWPTYFIDQYKNNLNAIGNSIAIFDRYKLSVEAIQKGVLSYNNIIMNDNQFFKDTLSKLPEPDMGILIDVPTEVMAGRYKSRGGRCHLDTRDLEITDRIRKIFLDLAKERQYLVLDGKQPEELLFDEIIRYFEGGKLK